MATYFSAMICIRRPQVVAVFSLVICCLAQATALPREEMLLLVNKQSGEQEPQAA